jgi:hypothetical protein
LKPIVHDTINHSLNFCKNQNHPTVYQQSFKTRVIIIIENEMQNIYHSKTIFHSILNHSSSWITPIIKLNYKSLCISSPDKINKKIRRPSTVYQISCQLAPPFRTCWTSVPSPIALSRAQSFPRKLAAPSLQINYPRN